MQLKHHILVINSNIRIMKRTLLILLCCLCYVAYGQSLQANFYALGGTTPYYSMGWDSVEEANKWKYFTLNNTATWQLFEQPSWKGLKPFSYFNPNSKFSLGISYSNKKQKETAQSPQITIKPNSTCSFYACFSPGLLVFAKWKLLITDVDTKETTELLDAFKWSQDNAFDGPNWNKFNIKLSAYAQKKVQFSFVYEGSGGEDVFIDGFEVSQNDANATSIQIVEGEEVAFYNSSVGKVTSYNWKFKGGTPNVSTDENPKVVYAKAGTYPVTLTVSNGTEEHTFTREAYVNVSKKAPQAYIGVEPGGYLSPFVGRFIALGSSLTFKDLSKGNPTQWQWSFKGANIEQSNEQNPTVTYNKQGVFSVGLRATNDAGTSKDALVNYIQVGGQQHIWNITPEENPNLNVIGLGFYGFYAGSNWLGMSKFAEHFDVPQAKAEVKSVDVYFGSTVTVSPNAEVSVSLALADDKGMPGQVLATSTLKASELVYDNNTIKPTTFTFNTPAMVEKEFFVVIGGLPNNDEGNKSDKIAILCLRRQAKEKSTTYHLLADEDGNNKPTGTYTWHRNDDEPLSMAVCPLLSYDLSTTALPRNEVNVGETPLRFDGTNLLTAVDYDAIEVYAMHGARVLSATKPPRVLSLRHLSAGVYVVKATRGKVQDTLKVVR